ncbi:hypothetical protein BJ138DRAFT_1164751 [Hygrophoropsis aurantiaca]|uniref:Uncharacterized protein n=1 Tax=Hygrophoropsis aurantiaca TaxID=72124 RepID=A0ACB7ZXP2_9AGAM|nr:hypothetical protein BJ138DRAFT_1164751 [Hygrophoropsis aurantiaca]
MQAFQRDAIKNLPIGDETKDKAYKYLGLTQGRTGPGTGYLLANVNALPILCAYLASQTLNNKEFTEKAALASACMSKSLFTKDLNIVRALVNAQTDQARFQDITYEALIRAHHVAPASEALDWMEEVEATFPHADTSLKKYGLPTIKCVVFYWVTDAMEIHEVRETLLLENYNVNKTAFRTLYKTIDKSCEAIADMINEEMTRRQASRPSASQSKPSLSPKKSPSKPSLKGKSIELTPSKPTGQKRVIIARSRAQDFDDDTSFPDTPTKKRKLDSPSKSITSSSPRKRTAVDTPSSTTSYHLAMNGVNGASGNREESLSSKIAPPSFMSPIPGPSTPRKTRNHSTLPVEKSGDRDLEETDNAREQLLPRRFRPIFLEQQQWCNRDPKIQHIWKQADEHKSQMMALYGHPFERFRARTVV